MSATTDMLICTAGDEREAMARLNAWCARADTKRAQEFERLDTGAAGGWRLFGTHVWAMAGSHFPYWELRETFAGFGWRDPDNVILIIKHEHDDTAEVHRAGTVGGG